MTRPPISLLFSVILITACATKLDEPPGHEELLGESLPETTVIPAEWTAPEGDNGAVDDGWLADFNDPQLEMLVAEALEAQNPNMRLLSAQVDRAEAMARLGNAALQPTVMLGADLSETGGNEAVSGTSSSLYNERTEEIRLAAELTNSRGSLWVIMILASG